MNRVLSLLVSLLIVPISTFIMSMVLFGIFLSIILDSLYTSALAFIYNYEYNLESAGLIPTFPLRRYFPESSVFVFSKINTSYYFKPKQFNLHYYPDRYYSNSSYSSEAHIGDILPDFLEWFVGLIDAEGLFGIYLNKSGLPKFTFRIALHQDDLAVLKLLQNRFNTGTITKSLNMYIYTIGRGEAFESVLFPILDIFPLNTSKNLDYLIFKKAYF